MLGMRLDGRVDWAGMPRYAAVEQLAAPTFTVIDSPGYV